MSWEKVKLADLCSVITKGTTPSNIGASFTPIGINYIRSEMVTASKYISSTGMLYISRETHEKLKRSQLQVGDILFSMAGVYLGKTAILRYEDVPANTNQAVALIRTVPEKCYREYIYYFLNSPNIIKSVNTITSQSAQPNINLTQIGNIEIVLPPIETQKKIADILSAYDDLIENNQKQIKLLEEAAQRLYKEWFIDLHFPGYESTPIINGIPQGWKKENLGSIAPILTGKKDANFGTEDGKYPFFTCSQEPIKAPSYSFDTSAVILAGNGDFNVKLYRGKFEAYQRTYVLSPNEEQYLYLLYYAVTDNMAKFIKGASGSTIKFLTKGMIENVSLFIPNRDILIQFNTFMESIQCKIECLKLSIINATEARDRLLPKLMNGEIKVGMDKQETAKKDNFDYIRQHWKDVPYDEDLPLAARSTGDISEETLEKLKEIAEEE